MDNQGEQVGEKELTSSDLADATPDLIGGRGKKIVQNLINNANRVKPELDTMLKLAGAQNGLDPNMDFSSRVKNPETIIRKVAAHRLEGKDHYKANDVNDVYGGRFIIKSPEQQNMMIEAIQDLGKRNQFKVLKEEAKNNDTYHAYHIDIAKDGVRGEIQLHTPASYFESVANHEVRARYDGNPPPALETQKQKVLAIGHRLPPQTAQLLAKAIEMQRAQQQQGGVS